MAGAGRFGAACATEEGSRPRGGTMADGTGCGWIVFGTAWGTGGFDTAGVAGAVRAIAAGSVGDGVGGSVGADVVVCRVDDPVVRARGGGGTDLEAVSGA